MIQKMVITTSTEGVVARFPDCQIARLKPRRKFAWHYLISDLAAMYSAAASDGTAIIQVQGQIPFLNPRWDLTTGLSTLTQFGFRRNMMMHHYNWIRWIGYPLTGIVFRNLMGGASLAAFMVVGEENIQPLVDHIRSQCTSDYAAERLDPIFTCLERVDCFGVLAQYMSPALYWGIQWGPPPQHIFQVAPHITAAVPHTLGRLPFLPLPGRYNEFISAVLPPIGAESPPVTMFIERPELGFCLRSLVAFLRRFPDYQWVLVTDRRVSGARDVQITRIREARNENHRN